MLVWDFNDRLHSGSKVALTSSHPHSYLRAKTLSKSPEKIAITDYIGFGKMFGWFAVSILEELFRKTENGRYELK